MPLELDDSVSTDGATKHQTQQVISLLSDEEEYDNAIDDTRNRQGDSNEDMPLTGSGRSQSYASRFAPFEDLDDDVLVTESRQRRFHTTPESYEDSDDDVPRPASRRRRPHIPQSESYDDPSSALSDSTGSVGDSDIEPSDDPVIYDTEKSRLQRFHNEVLCLESAEDIKTRYPLSLRMGQVVPNPTEIEIQALLDIEEIAGLQRDDRYPESFLFEEIHDFSIYRAFDYHKNFRGQFEMPHIVAREDERQQYYLDGELRRNNEVRKLVRVPIRPGGVQFGALDDLETHTAKDDIWLQTCVGKQYHDTWYQLKTPSAEYKRTWDQCLWLADLAKHLSDFLVWSANHGMSVGIQDLNHSFLEQLQVWHGSNDDFRRWHAACGETVDFRKHVLRNSQFLWDTIQSLQIDEINEQPLWDQIGHGDVDSEDCKAESAQEQTVVTPNVARCFLQSFPQWGSKGFDLLKVVDSISDAVKKKREAQRKKLGFPNNLHSGRSEDFEEIGGHLYSRAALWLQEAGKVKTPTTLSAAAMVGKVVVIKRRRDSLPPGVYDYQYAWVKTLSSTGENLKVVWLLLPSRTICGRDSHYPVGNELFIDGDACHCRTAISPRNVVAVFDAVIVGTRSSPNPQLFIQQMYSEEDCSITWATEEALQCVCQRKAKPQQSPTPPKDELLPKLKVISIFSGAGLLDSALEDTGLFETVYACDCTEIAMKSHQINSKSSDCRHFIGSVNDALLRMASGQDPICLGHCLVAGCPCQGFSMVNMERGNITGQRNCSLVASLMSWIDVNLPLFVLIENVPSMDNSNLATGKPNACEQTIAFLVGLGYQVRKMLLSANHFGGNTSRERLFIVGAAPCVALPAFPLVTHVEWPDQPHLQKERKVADVIDDLEPIDEDLSVNPLRPDHIPIMRLGMLDRSGITVSLRNVVQHIPTHSPPGQGMANSFHLLRRHQQQWFENLTIEQQRENGTTVRRIHPQKPFPTMVTNPILTDARGSGRIIHPFEDRTVSLEECRRQQGVADDFLLVGTVAEQVKQLGNGVAWQVGKAIGMTFGEALRTTIHKLGSMDRLLELMASNNVPEPIPRGTGSTNVVEREGMPNQILQPEGETPRTLPSSEPRILSTDPSDKKNVSLQRPVSSSRSRTPARRRRSTVHFSSSDEEDDETLDSKLTRVTEAFNSRSMSLTPLSSVQTSSSREQRLNRRNVDREANSSVQDLPDKRPRPADDSDDDVIFVKVRKINP